MRSSGERFMFSDDIPPRWLEQSGTAASFFDAERQAERFASNARLAFFADDRNFDGRFFPLWSGRWNDWVAVIAGGQHRHFRARVAFLVHLAVLPRIVPLARDLRRRFAACSEIGLVWTLAGRPSPPETRVRLGIAPWGAFLLLAITSLGVNAWRLLVQTLLLLPCN